MALHDCGDCTLCCRLLAVPETGKPAAQPCPHCSAKGCGIYPARPRSCRNFQCLWLMEEGFPEAFRPDRCGLVISFNHDRGNHDHDSVVVHVDPARPGAIAAPDGEALLQAPLSASDPVFVVRGEERMMVRRSPIPELSEIASLAAEPFLLSRVPPPTS